MHGSERPKKCRKDCREDFPAPGILAGKIPGNFPGKSSGTASSWRKCANPFGGINAFAKFTQSAP